MVSVLLQRYEQYRRSFVRSGPYDGQVEDVHIARFDVGKDAVKEDGVEDGAQGLLEQCPLHGLWDAVVRMDGRRIRCG